MPLLNQEIPSWAAEFRREKVKGVGTSLYIPYTLYNAGLVHETIITVVANFFFAIQNDKLIVYVADRKISHENLKRVYGDCKRWLFDEKDEIDVDHVKNCFKSIDTILNSSYDGQQQIPNFGNIVWYLRMDEEMDWHAVAIARESGMLITRCAPKLQRFPNVKCFDLFVWVIGEKGGSELLKRLENPQHNDFEFDRIRDIEERKKVEKEYSKFAEKIRGIISQYASIDAEDEESVDELGYLFHSFSEEGSSPNSQSERGEQMCMFEGPIVRLKRRYKGKELESSEILEESFNRGARSGVGEKVTEGGDIPDLGGSTPLQDGVPSDQGAPSTERLRVHNFRVHHLGENNEAIFYFDPPKTGEYEFVIYRVGENKTEIVNIINTAGTELRGVFVEVEEGERKKLSLKFTSNISQFALEGALHEKS